MPTVYQFSMYDIDNDHMQKSRRWATLAAIEKIGGRALTHAPVVIPEEDLVYEGMTEIGYDPFRSKSGQFQRKVF